MKLMTVLLGVGALSACAMGSDLQSSGLIVLNSHSDRALEMVGNSTVRIAGRAVFVNSDHAQAVRTTGNATLDCPTLNVVGGVSYSGNSGCTGQTCHPAVGYADPLNNTVMPTPRACPPWRRRTSRAARACWPPAITPTASRSAATRR